VVPGHGPTGHRGVALDRVGLGMRMITHQRGREFHRPDGVLNDHCLAQSALIWAGR
jgi:hypothetical protein